MNLDEIRAVRDARSLPSAPPLFRLGRTVMTPGVQSSLNDVACLFRALRLHESGNWGEVPPEDWLANEAALETGDRVLSVFYVLARESDQRLVTIWIITEADRSVTTILLPDEY